MEAVGTLAGGIAHDFHNILTPILGYTQILMDDSRPGEKRYSCLRQPTRASRPGTDPSNLTFSRRNDAEKQPLTIVLIIKEDQTAALLPPGNRQRAPTTHQQAVHRQG